MNAHGASVYRLALNQTRSPHDAEDVSQDVFLRLLRDKTDFVDDGHLKAWLLRATINRCLEVRRSAWRRRAVIGADEEWATLEAVVDEDPADDPEAHALAALAKNPVWKAMQQLPEAWRLAVHPHHVEGYSTEEIAQLTHCKAATVRTRLHRARKKLRDALANAEKADSAREPARQGQARISASRPSTKREGVGGMHAAPSKAIYRAAKEVPQMRNQPSQPGTLDEYAELMGSIDMPQGVRSAVMTEAHEAEANTEAASAQAANDRTARNSSLPASERQARIVDGSTQTKTYAIGLVPDYKQRIADSWNAANESGYDYELAMANDEEPSDEARAKAEAGPEEPALYTLTEIAES